MTKTMLASDLGLGRLPGEPGTIALLSPCGWGNLGDAAIMSAAIDQIRARQPNAEIVAFTLNPPDTEQRHGVPTFAIDASTFAGFSVERAGLTGVRRLAQRALQRVRGVSCRLANALCRVLNVTTFPVREARHWWSSYRVVRKCRFVVVCGGGQVDELWGGPWGHPYALFKFALLTRLSAKRDAARTRFVVLSSGSAKLSSGLGRWFVGKALRWADYRSFREQFAVELARELGAPEPNRWLPDLAFSLDASAASSPPAERGLTVGVSPIAWLDPRFWPEKDGKQYERYFGQMADFLQKLLAREKHVVLFATAAVDHIVIADLVRVLRDQGISNLDVLLTVSSARTVPDLLEVLDGVDAVVASRLHGVLLAYTRLRPAVAISYDPKVDQLVESFDQTDLSFSISALDGGKLLKALDRACATREAIAQHLAVKVTECQELLSEQYDQVFGRVAIQEMGHSHSQDHSVLQAQPIA